MNRNRVAIDPIIETVRRVRRARGISQDEMTNMSGLAPSTINSWENGRYNASIAKFRQLLDGLNLDLAVIDRATGIPCEYEGTEW